MILYGPDDTVTIESHVSFVSILPPATGAAVIPSLPIVFTVRLKEPNIRILQLSKP